MAPPARRERRCISSAHPCSPIGAGVTDVTTSVEAKLVTCKVAAPASTEAVVAALEKWGKASKKEVALLPVDA